MVTQSLVPSSPQYGTALENWILHELRARRSYGRTHVPLTFWRSTAQHEVDFCLGDEIAIEVKSTQRLNARHFRGLQALQEEKVFKRFIMVSFDSSTRKWDDEIECFPVEEFLLGLAQGEFDPKGD